LPPKAEDPKPAPPGPIKQSIGWVKNVISIGSGLIVALKVASIFIPGLAIVTKVLDVLLQALIAIGN
jgi:hypothetical protein